MAETKMTDEQILAKLDNDSNFGLQFMVENQPDLIIDRLKQAGYDQADTKEKAFESLKKLLETNPKKVGEILNNIPYDDAAPNWTGGFGMLGSEVKADVKTLSNTGGDLQGGAQTQGGNSSGGFNWGGLLTGIGGLFSGIGMAFGGGTNLTPDQMAFYQQQQMMQAEQERKRRQTTAFLVIGGLAIAVIIIAIVMSNKKKDK